MAQNKLPFLLSSVNEPPIADPQLDELIRWGRLFDELGLAPSYGTGSHGNLSIRSKRGCLISATQTFLGTIEPSHFVEIIGCDERTAPPTILCRGALRPSTDSLIHWHLYQWRPETACVLHAHDPLTLAAADQLDIPQTERPADAGSPDLVELIRPLAQHSYFLVREHGFVAQAKTINEAGELALAVHRRAQQLIEEEEKL